MGHVLCSNRPVVFYLGIVVTWEEPGVSHHYYQWMGKGLFVISFLIPQWKLSVLYPERKYQYSYDWLLNDDLTVRLRYFKIQKNKVRFTTYSKTCNFLWKIMVHFVVTFRGGFVGRFSEICDWIYFDYLSKNLDIDLQLWKYPRIQYIAKFLSECIK